MKNIEEQDIKIGFKYSVFHKGSLSWENYWTSFEVVGILYNDGYQGGRSEWKNKKDILSSLERQAQVISLDDKFQQRIFNISTKKLYKKFKGSYKLLPEFREIKVD